MIEERVFGPKATLVHDRRRAQTGTMAKHRPNIPAAFVKALELPEREIQWCQSAAHNFAKIRPVMGAAIKNGMNVLDALIRIAKLQPVIQTD